MILKIQKNILNGFVEINVKGVKINHNIMTFNIDTLSNKGIDILPLLLKLLKIKREQIKIKNYFKGIKT